jgi:hypothetical protein
MLISGLHSSGFGRSTAAVFAQSLSTLCLSADGAALLRESDLLGRLFMSLHSEDGLISLGRGAMVQAASR